MSFDYRKCERCKAEYRPVRQAQSYCTKRCRREAAYGRERFAAGTVGARKRRLQARDSAPPHSHTATYQSWRCMRDRCINPDAPNYERYGGRGISVCTRWADFEAFLADMGPRPERHTLDRIDVNGSYAPENCRWATASEQERNKRASRKPQEAPEASPGMGVAATFRKGPFSSIETVPYKSPFPPIEDKYCGPTPGALQGDDYQLEYYPDGYPKLPECLARNAT